MKPITWIIGIVIVLWYLMSKYTVSGGNAQSGGFLTSLDGLFGGGSASPLDSTLNPGAHDTGAPITPALGSATTPYNGSIRTSQFGSGSVVLPYYSPLQSRVQQGTVSPVGTSISTSSPNLTQAPTISNQTPVYGMPHYRAYV